MSEEGGIESITIKAGDGPEVKLTSIDELRTSRAAKDLVEGVVRNVAGKRLSDSRENEAEQPFSRYIPGTAAFFGGSEWIESSELEELARTLVGRYAELHHLRDYKIRVLWKAEGGGSKGRVLYGRCSKPSGMTSYFALCDWVIWLAADNCREARFTDHQVEALLYHELKHCVLVGKESKPGVVGHDFEVFGDELRRYGFWNEGRAALKRAVQGAFTGMGD